MNMPEEPAEVPPEEKPARETDSVAGIFGPPKGEPEIPDGPAVASEPETSRHADALFRRDPSEKIDVELERERVKNRLDGFELLKAEKQRKADAGDEGSAKEVKEIEKVEKALKTDLEKISLADECNEVLGDFGELSAEDLEAYLETGKDKNGNEIKDKHGNKRHLQAHQVKHLAHLAKGGVTAVTWEHMDTLYQVVDELLKEVKSVFKRVVGLG